MPRASSNGAGSVPQIRTSRVRRDARAGRRGADSAIEWGVRIDSKEKDGITSDDDLEAFSLIVDLILIDGGGRRDSGHVAQLFPILCMLLVGDRTKMRVADMLPEDFALIQRRKKTA